MQIYNPFRHIRTTLKFGIIIVASITLSSSFQIRHNRLSADEKKEGWGLLFDGKTTKGWHTFQRVGFVSPIWKVEDNTLTMKKAGGGDLVTDQQFENFELSLDWKILNGGSSGILFHVSEEKNYASANETGPEMQLIDDHQNPEGQLPKRTCGAAYDLAIPLVKSGRKAGEWNHIRLIVNQGNVTQYLNGQLTARYRMGSPEWDSLVKTSKFKDMPSYGMMQKGHIVLQDEGSPVWFRNLKIKKLASI